MRSLVLPIALVLLAATAASAQRTPVRLFEDLPKVVTLGETVIVREKDGVKREGRLIALSDDQLQLKLSGLVFGSSTESFAAARIGWIDRRDSPVHGLLIGLGIGTGVAVIGCSKSEGGAGARGYSSRRLQPSWDSRSTIS